MTAAISSHVSIWIEMFRMGRQKFHKDAHEIHGNLKYEPFLIQYEPL